MPEWIGKPLPQSEEETAQTARQARYATWLQTAAAFLTLAIALSSALVSYIVANNTRMAIVEMRLGTVEKRADGYDALILQRQKQWEDLARDLGEIKQSLRDLERTRKDGGR